ncbi:hypothetical protein Scep_000049 [Stephania cephalantha]|uniref:Trafficking protein particle complex subunit 11 domain-containing protein n=1 Tax=Stephania cephalantha TaxID=152367 RepID=A0AAP0Q2L0_9MAGN
MPRPSSIHTNLSSQTTTPINTIALPDFSAISLLQKTNKETLDSAVPPGILKRDWLSKHRTRVPVVVAALFASAALSGDPAQWLQVCTDLENLKLIARGRNTKLVVVIVQSTIGDEVSEDRMIALRKRAKVDSKYLLKFVQDETSELNASLSRLGSTLAELANTYYKEEGRRIKVRIEKKNVNSIELIIRYCFKASIYLAVAVYAEFRRDWAEALRFYEEAYHTLREMIGVSTRLPPIQRLVEIKTIAEQFHFKVSTLLLHGGSRQFLVFAELLETSSATISNTTSSPSAVSEKSLTEWESHPAYYYHFAAHYLKEKRRCLEFALSASGTSGVPLPNGTESGPDSVVPSVYVGQFSRLLEKGDSMQPITDAEFTSYAFEEGKRFQDSFEIIALLKKSIESYNVLKASRMASYCRNLMAREYFTIGDFTNAKQIFEDVVHQYRQEGWVTLLWEVLGYLRECARKLKFVKDFIEYSLEMAALPISSDTPSEMLDRNGEYCPAGPASPLQRQLIHKEVFQLVKGQVMVSSEEWSCGLQINADEPVHLEIDPISPLRVVFLASVAFHEQVVKPGVPTLLTLSFLSKLPIPIEIDHLEIQFNQSDCNFIVTKAHREQVDSDSDSQQDLRVETASFLSIGTSKWLRLTYSIRPENCGKLECIAVIAKIGPSFTICCRAESPASMDDLPLWKYEDCLETLPTKDHALALSGQKVIQVEELQSRVDLTIGPSGPALVGESFLVPVTVTSKGHPVCSGELKINLVDPRGGGLVSPRELEPFSTESHHVQLLSVLGPDDKESLTGPDNNIINIQQSFGLLSVPHLSIGQSWSCKLEIKWHRPKPVMLYVSLGYLPKANEASAQKFNVHRSLQIDGVTAVAISHHFMLPFRRDPLLLSKIRSSSPPEQSTSLPLNEKSILVVSAKNCTEVPLQLISMSLDVDAHEVGQSCTVQPEGDFPSDPCVVVPGKEFKQVFSVIPEMISPTLGLGTVRLKWRRECGSSSDAVITRHTLPDIKVETPPIIVTLECPPHAILGDPFTYHIRIQNQTQVLQEIKYSLSDSQSFVCSGSHSDTIFVLPKSEHILSYKVVPLVSGPQQLPRVAVTSIRYSAGLDSSPTATTIFVFPFHPHFRIEDEVARDSSPAATEPPPSSPIQA